MWRRVAVATAARLSWGGVGASAARMNGYPKIFNIESDPREEHNIAEMYEWLLGPVLKAVGEYKATLDKHPNPPAANMTRW
jgi:arylsulfatase